MHAAVGGIYSGVTAGNVASGAIGGATSELVIARTGSPEVTKLSAAVTSFALNQAAKGIELSSTTAESAVENNFLQHIPKVIPAVKLNADISLSSEQKSKRNLIVYRILRNKNDSLLKTLHTVLSFLNYKIIIKKYTLTKVLLTKILSYFLFIIKS